MAKKPVRRRRASFGNRTGQLAKIPIQVSQALGALADGAVVKATLNNFSDEVVVMSSKLTWTLFNNTAGQGPINVGIATDDLSVGEIQEAINASPTSRSDHVAFEQASRPVRQAGAFAGLSTEEVLNDGRPLRQKLGLAVANNNDPVFYANNVSGGALTTGTSLRVIGHIIVKWQ